MEALLAIVPFFIMYVPILVLTIYSLVLFIKLARRGIKALDIYLGKNQNTYND